MKLLRFALMILVLILATVCPNTEVSADRQLGDFEIRAEDVPCCKAMHIADLLDHRDDRTAPPLQVV